MSKTKMAGVDVLAEQIKSICKNSENTNQIQGLLVKIEEGNNSEIRNSIDVLFGVFSYHLKVGTWLKLDAADQQHNLNNKSIIGKDVLSAWLSSSYSAFLTLLAQQLKQDSAQDQRICFQTYFHLVNREHETGKSDVKPPGRFMGLLRELLQCKITDELLAIIDDLMMHLDIQCYFFQKTAALYQKENFKVNECVIENTFKILQIITKNLIDVENGEATLYFRQKDKKFRRNYKTSFSNTWLTFLRQNMTSTLRKKVLIDLDTKIIPHLHDPKVLIDFLTDSYSAGGVTSLLSLNSLFILISEYNLDYPDFYKNLYVIIDSSIFHMKYKSRFFNAIDLFLSSTHLPAYLVASFVKKFSRMLLYTPVTDLMMMLTFIKNMLIRHPSCRVLIHRKQVSRNMEEMKGDPFNYDETELSQCHALQSSLWEVDSMMSHFSSDVKKLVASFKKDLPSMELDITEQFDKDYEDLFQEKIDKLSSTEKEIPVNFDKASNMFECIENDCWILN